MHRITLLPGDGIGPEVVDSSVSVLNTLTQVVPGLKFDFTTYPMGAGEYLLNGNPLPEATIEGIQQADAVLLGAMGLPSVRWPDGTEMVPQIEIRELFDTYAGERPLKLYNEKFGVLKGYKKEDIDILLIRENTEGLFSARKEPKNESGEFEEDVMRITQNGAERVCRYAFERAMDRPKKHLTLVDKANVLKSNAFLREIFLSIAPEYPEVTTDCVYIDAFALFLVQRPHTFDVVVTENMFGDIMSDLGAGLVGGMGMAPSSDIGDRCGIFQPSHGTAPDIAGKGWANPTATILSAAMMLEYLNEDEAASLIYQGVEKLFEDAENATKDLGGTKTTSELTDCLTQIIKTLR